MGRKIAISKIENTTIVKVKEDGVNVTETLIYNKTTDYNIRNNQVVVESSGDNARLTVKHDELEDDGGTASLEEWVEAVAAPGFFFAF